MNGSRTPLAIFGIPALVAALALTGLVGALLADGLWDWGGAVLLGSSLAVAAWALATRRR